MPDYATLYADHDTMANHWWWRPGWYVGTRFYAWHITQEAQTPVVDLALSYQAALRDVETLDPIPEPWLHMTLQGYGHAADVPPKEIERVHGAVAKRLADLSPIVATYQRAHIFREAIALPPSNPEAFTELRRSIRSGITDSVGHCPENEGGFRAHVSLAYSNDQASAQPIRDRLDARQPTEAVTARYDHVSLILMHRDRQMYEWETIDVARIGA